MNTPSPSAADGVTPPVSFFLGDSPSDPDTTTPHPPQTPASEAPHWRGFSVFATTKFLTGLPP